MGALRAALSWLGRGRAPAAMCGALVALLLGATPASAADPCDGGPRGHATSGDDVIVDSGASHTINGGDGNDTIYGCGGNDTIYGGGGGDKIYGGKGNDRLFGQLLDDKLHGGPDRDLLVGGHGFDNLFGDGGNDWLRGGDGGDLYDGGGGGNDVASFMGARPQAGANPVTTGVAVNLKAGTASGEGSDHIRGVESVLGSAFDDTLTGNGNGAASGGPGADTCTGFTNDSQCDGSNPARPFVSLETWTPNGFPLLDPALVVVGGPTAATISMSLAPGGFAVTPAPTGFQAVPPCTSDPDGSVLCPLDPRPIGGVATLWGGEGIQTLNVSSPFPRFMTVEVDGGPGNDSLNGADSEDDLYGADGADVVHGNGGEDALISFGQGADQLFGDAGNDQLATDDPCQGHTYHGGPGRDIAGFARTTGIPGVPGDKTGINATLGGQAFFRTSPPCATPTTLVDDNSVDPATGKRRQDILEILEGTKNPDLLFGNRRPNTLWGRGGNDVLRGRDGADILNGHEGADRLLGEGGFDRLFARDRHADLQLDCGADGGRLVSYDRNLDPVNGCPH